jgi:cation transport ATPase
MAENEMLRMAGAVNARSSHPLAQAALAEVAPRDLAVGKFKTVAGDGVKAQLASRLVLVGTGRLLDRKGVALDGLSAEVDRLISEGGKSDAR